MSHSKESNFDPEDFRSLAVGLKQKIFEVIEELKVKRVNGKENEDKINRLLKDKYEMQRQHDEEVVKLNKSINVAKEYAETVQQEFEEKNLQNTGKKDLQQISEDLYTKEIKVFKDEIIALQLSKYNLEKKIREQESQLKMQSTCKENWTTQITSLEMRCKNMEEQCANLEEKVSSSEQRVRKATELQRNLIHTNEHQKCVINELKNELNQAKESLLRLKTEQSIHFRTQQDEEKTLIKEQFQQSLERSLEKLKAQFEERISRLSKENEGLHESLTKSSQLVLKVTKRLEEVTNNEAMLQFQVDELKQELGICRSRNIHLQTEYEAVKADKDENANRISNNEILKTHSTEQEKQITVQSVAIQCSTEQGRGEDFNMQPLMEHCKSSQEKSSSQGSEGELNDKSLTEAKINEQCHAGAKEEIQSLQVTTVVNDVVENKDTKINKVDTSL